MAKNLKNIISHTLVFIFLAPTMVKLVDVFFHHHDHFICIAKKEKHYHEPHKTCPIPNFKISLFPEIKDIQIIKKTFYWVEQNDNYIFIYYFNNSKFLFLLRAPPQNLLG